MKPITPSNSVISTPPPSHQTQKLFAIQTFLPQHFAPKAKNSAGCVIFHLPSTFQNIWTTCLMSGGQRRQN